MKNKLIDLNNHLFAQLERLGDEGLTESELKKEIERAKSMKDLGQVIINNAALSLDTAKFKSSDDFIKDIALPPMIEDKPL